MGYYSSPWRIPREIQAFRELAQNEQIRFGRRKWAIGIGDRRERYQGINFCRLFHHHSKHESSYPLPKAHRERDDSDSEWHNIVTMSRRVFPLIPRWLQNSWMSAGWFHWVQRFYWNLVPLIRELKQAVWFLLAVRQPVHHQPVHHLRERGARGGVILRQLLRDAAVCHSSCDVVALTRMRRAKFGRRATGAGNGKVAAWLAVSFRSSLEFKPGDAVKIAWHSIISSATTLAFFPVSWSGFTAADWRLSISQTRMKRSRMTIGIFGKNGLIWGFMPWQKSSAVTPW